MKITIYGLLHQIIIRYYNNNLMEHNITCGNYLVKITLVIFFYCYYLN